MFGFNFTVCTYFSHVTIPRANKEFNWINNTVSGPVPRLLLTLVQSTKCRQKNGGFWWKMTPFPWLLVPKFMVTATEQGSNMSPPQFSHPPGFYKNISAFCSEFLLFWYFRHIFSTVDHLFKDLGALHVNSRPWSVKDNKQLLKPGEMWAKTILQARENIRIYQTIKRYL
jgi:hypothetical protein